MLLENKNIIVTGASDGLGHSITKSLISKGAHVVAIARNDEKLKGLAEEFGNKVTVYPCDITDSDKYRSLLGKVLGTVPIDGIINNAGMWHRVGPLESIDTKIIEQLIALNLTAVIVGTQAVLSSLKGRKEAVIVNISSKSGSRPQEGQTVYCSSKFGVRGFTDTLKLELKGSAVKVMGFYPSGMATEMFAKSGEEFSAAEFMNTDEIADIITYAIERPGNISIEEIQVEKY